VLKRFPAGCAKQRARVLSMLQVCSNNVKRCRYKTILNFPRNIFVPRKANCRSIFDTSSIHSLVLNQKFSALLRTKILMIGKFKLFLHFADFWGLFLQKVVCLRFFTRYSSCLLWSSLKNCEISRQMLV